MSSGKNGFVMSGIISPYVPLLPYFNVIALLFGKNLVSSTTLRTRSIVAGRTRLDPLMTRDTVALETPASLAMSRMSIVRFVLPGGADDLPVNLDGTVRMEEQLFGDPKLGPRTF